MAIEPSILKSTKKILGLPPEATAFDLDIITHINSVFGILEQMGIGPAGFFIEDDAATWLDYSGEEYEYVPLNQLNLVRTYIYIKVRAIFDPPTTSFMITAMDKQIEEYEHRLSIYRETELAAQE